MNSEPKPRTPESEAWLTREGVLHRASLFSQFMVYRSYNLYIQTGARMLGAWGYEYVLHPELSKTGPCPECEPFGGRQYRMGQFTPYVPRHPRCVCSLDPIFLEAIPGLEWGELFGEDPVRIERMLNQALEDLPQKHVDLLTAIKIEPMNNIAGRMHSNPETGEATLEIDPQYGGPTTVKHEMGHAVMRHLMSEEDWSDWETVWELHKEEMPTDYAKTKAPEGFAELYRINHGGERPRDKLEKADFVSEIAKVMSGEETILKDMLDFYLESSVRRRGMPQELADKLIEKRRIVDQE